MNIAVFVSGNGSNLKALIEAQKQGYFSGGNILLVVSDNPEALALQRAKKAQIRTAVFVPADYDSREDLDRAIISELKGENIQLIVLAGYMRLLSGYFIKEYEKRILNIHPSLLPAFKGVHGIKDAYDYGVKVTGVTVHFVTEELDAGPVILQKEVVIKDKDSLSQLEEKIHEVEHKLYPEAVRMFVEGRLKIEGRKVEVVSKKME